MDGKMVAIGDSYSAVDDIAVVDEVVPVDLSLLFLKIHPDPDRTVH
jgi:hypothetical protein